MTIAQLLSVNGASAPRYIRVDGRTVFGPVTATAIGLVHPTHGAVTAVPRHTFHGGPDPVDDGQAEWWSEPDEIKRHGQAMTASFPGFTYVAADGDLPPYWHGTLDTGRGMFRVGIVLRRDRGLPHARVLSRQRLGRDCAGKFIASPHLYLGGALCIADQDDWCPDEHTAATVTAWTAHWLSAFTEWRITTRWPVDGAHAAA